MWILRPSLYSSTNVLHPSTLYAVQIKEARYNTQSTSKGARGIDLLLYKCRDNELRRCEEQARERPGSNASLSAALMTVTNSIEFTPIVREVSSALHSIMSLIMYLWVWKGKGYMKGSTRNSPDWSTVWALVHVLLQWWDRGKRRSPLLSFNLNSSLDIA